jgi:hypothetical protein
VHDAASEVCVARARAITASSRWIARNGAWGSRGSARPPPHPHASAEISTATHITTFDVSARWQYA